MPIYEFYCPDCHTVFNFFSRSINTQRHPLCPRCGKIRLKRCMSVFSVPRCSEGEEEGPLPDVNEAQMQSAMNALAKQAEAVDEDDPRQAADLMRNWSDMTGLKLGPGMEEALRRMEAGEDPEKIEAELGDVLEEEDPFAPRGKYTRNPRLRPPEVDETLYEL